MVHEMISDPLTRDHNAVVAKLIHQELVHAPLGGIGQPWRAGVDRHAVTLPEAPMLTIDTDMTGRLGLLQDQVTVSVTRPEWPVSS